MASSKVDHMSQGIVIPPCRDEDRWQGGVTKYGLLWEEPIPHYGLKGMG